MNSGIYCIKNIVNGKVYIGSSNNLKRRKRQHFTELRNNKHYNQYLQNSYNKYGKKKFDFFVLEYIKDSDKLIEVEQKYLDELDFNFNYNISRIAYGVSVFGEDNHFYGKKHSEETKELLRQINTGKKYSKETKELKRQQTLGKNNPNYGNNWTEEMKYQQSVHHGTPIIINGIEYPSAKYAAKQLDLSSRMILYRVKSQNFSNYKYKEEKDIKIRPKKNRKIIIDGQKYKSSRQASIVLGNITGGGIIKRINSKNFPNYRYDDSEVIILRKEKDWKCIKINGVSYSTILAAEKELKISRSTIGGRLKNTNFPNYQYVKEKPLED